MLLLLVVFLGFGVGGGGYGYFEDDEEALENFAHGRPDVGVGRFKEIVR